MISSCWDKSRIYYYTLLTSVRAITSHALLSLIRGDCLLSRASLGISEQAGEGTTDSKLVIESHREARVEISRSVGNYHILQRV